MYTQSIPIVSRNPSDGRDPHLMRRESSVLWGLQYQDPIRIAVAVITWSREIVSAGVAKWRPCDYRQGVVGRIEPTSIGEPSHLRHINGNRRANGTKGQYQ